MNQTSILFVGWAYPDQQVGVQDHQIGGHLCRDSDLVSLQLCVHAEQHVVSVTVAAYDTKWTTKVVTNPVTGAHI